MAGMESGAAGRQNTALRFDTMSSAPLPPDDDLAFSRWKAEQGLGEAPGTEALFAALYQDLRRLARSRLRQERSDHTLSATALTHEAYMRLSSQDRVAWQNPAHFVAMAATMMRRILVDHALAKQADKRRGEHITLSAVDLEAQAPSTALDVLDLHRALTELGGFDPRAARVVELRYFGGLELDEIAEALSISLATVKRDWTVARAWLKSRLAAGAP
jgi:RNA polymerase sigma factor (TIGR02999 family)